MNPQNAHAFPETIAFGMLLVCLITTLFFIPADTYVHMIIQELLSAINWNLL